MWLTGNRLTGLSAGAWLSAMRRPFLGSRSDAKLDLVASSFRDWFVEPIARRLEKADADVRTGVEAVQMLIGKDAVAGIRLTDGSTIHADWYIMAVPHHRLPGLLPERLLTRYAYFQHITELRDVPAVTVRIMLEGHRAGPGLILCGGGPFHSVEVATADQETMIVLTAYADETSMSRPDEELARSALEQARAFVPAAQSGHRSTTITRHPAAFLALCPGTRALRPIHQSPLRNLLVAGAWTDTGRPPNLESAVMSGSRCAGIISTRS